MEAVHCSTVASRHISQAKKSFNISSSKYARKSTKISSSWTGSAFSVSISSRNLFTREIWGTVYAKSVRAKRQLRRGVVRAEMFGQLTSGLEAAWNKLKALYLLSKLNTDTEKRPPAKFILKE